AAVGAGIDGEVLGVGEDQPARRRARSPTDAPAPSRNRRPRFGQCREVLDDLAEVVRFGLSGGPAPGRRSSTPGRAQACYRF
ncbi:hypothetical protein, partial [Streptomyces sp. NPDC018347]